MKQDKYTIKDFNGQYSDEDKIIEKLFTVRYGHLAECPHCNRKAKFYRVRNEKAYACQWCSFKIHPVSGSIFHKSSTPLKLWFYAIFLFSNSKNGVSAKELERQLGVTYKTAWRIAQQIRKLFAEKSPLLDGFVEIDETLIGGRETNKHKSKKTKSENRVVGDKKMVIGAVERDGIVIARVIGNRESCIVQPFVRENISIEATVFSDDFHGYGFISEHAISYQKVNHSAKEYVRDEAHTNTIEGFWSQLKRSIHGTYHFVSPKYLQHYINEFAFRYNRRNDRGAIFHSLVRLAFRCVYN